MEYTHRPGYELMAELELPEQCEPLTTVIGKTSPQRASSTLFTMTGCTSE